MKNVAGMLAVLAMTLSASAAHAVQGMPVYVGNWYKDCGEGSKCRIYIQPTDRRDRFTFHFTLSPADGSSSDECTWNVPLQLDRKEKTLTAIDPNGNYGFYVMVDKKGNLRSSGTMLAICGGPRDMEEVFKVDDLNDIRDE